MPRSAFKVGSLSHNHPNSQPVRVASDASPSGVTKERSQSCRRPLQAKMVQTIAQPTAPTAKRLKRATRAPSAFPSMFHPRIRLTLATRRTSTIRRSRDLPAARKTTRRPRRGICPAAKPAPIRIWRLRMGFFVTVFIDPNFLSHGIHHARADSHLVGCQQSGNASRTSTTPWRLPSPRISRHSSSNLKRRNRIDR
jgi:hypothetical protein